VGKKKKQPQPPQPDDDGYIKTGMYERRVFSPDKLDELRAAIEANLEEAKRPAYETLEAILDQSKQIAMPFLDGPYSVSETLAMLRKGNVRIHVLDVGQGPQRFFEKQHLTEQARDAIEALHKVLDIENSDCGGRLFANALALGRLLERIYVRPFEPLVAQRKRSVESIDKINRNRPTAETLKRDAKEAIEKAKLEYPARSSDTNFIKTKAAESLGIQKRALNTRLSK